MDMDYKKDRNMDFGDRMKYYEELETDRYFIPLLPICVRLDGKCFHGFTNNLPKPDKRLHDLMVEVTKRLVKETNANIGYTQSDEISLILHTYSFDSQLYFDRKIFKVISVMAGYTSALFTSLIPEFIPEKKGKVQVFDCRAFNVPNLSEAVNEIIWREEDATKNSINMAASIHYSHTELLNKNCNEKQEMLFQKGVNFNDYPDWFKRGTYIQRKRVLRKFTTEELSRLPEKHEAKKNPDLMIERRNIVVVDMPQLNKVKNKIEVVFDGAEPEIGE